MKIAAIIQARMGSTRLPGKVLLPLEGKPVLRHVIERVRASRYVTDTVIATTESDDNLPIVKLCEELGAQVYRGSENDVLDRYYRAAKLLNPGHVVRITSDCPIMDAEVIDSVVKLHLESGSDYTSNTMVETFPDGEDVEAFTFASLEKAHKEARLKSEREHVTPYIKKNKILFKLTNLVSDKDYSRKRWTIDNLEDYEFLKVVFKNLYRINPLFGMTDVIAFLEKNPGIESINRHIQRNEGYAKSLKDDRPLGVKEK
jgi:spore coat polysaccharide biosynthesis protein SpsF